MWQKFKEVYLPTSILVSAVLISATLWYTRFSQNTQKDTEDKVTAEEKSQSPFSLTEKDHIRGNPEAPLLVVIFSDLECPYCKYMHNVMNEVLPQYEGKIQWVYKHFPLDSKHPKARKEAEATECAADVGGHQKFWEYIDRLFELTPSNNGLDLTLLPKIAEDVGIDKNAFSACLESGKYAEKIQADVTEGIKLRVQGTPAVFVGTEFIPGALPVEEFKAVLDSHINK